MKGIVLGLTDLSSDAWDWFDAHGVEPAFDPDNMDSVGTRTDSDLVRCVEELGPSADASSLKGSGLHVEYYDETKEHPKAIEPAGIDEYDREIPERAVYEPSADPDAIRDYVEKGDMDGLVSYLEERGIYAGREEDAEESDRTVNDSQDEKDRLVYSTEDGFHASEQEGRVDGKTDQNDDEEEDLTADNDENNFEDDVYYSDDDPFDCD